MSLPPDYNPMQEQSRLNQDAEFNEHMKRLLKHFRDIPEQRLRMFAGMPCDAGGINDTPLKCLRAAIPPYIPLPEGLEQKLAGSVVKPTAPTDDTFKQAWAVYVQACQARKARIAAARRVYEAQVAAAKAMYDLAQDEPMPEAPKRAAL